MKLPSVRLLGSTCAIGALTLGLACGSKSQPAAPQPVTTPTVAPTLAAPVAKTPIAAIQLDTLKPTLTVENSAATGTVGSVTYEFQVSELDTFPDNSRTSTEKGIAQGGGETSWTPPSDLIPVFTYYWHARATNGSITTDWTKTETFKTQIRAFRNGQSIYDPLTDGRTVASRIVGGKFITGANGGWQALSMNDGLDYDIPPCAACKVEFDATNFGNGEGSSAQVDVKWFSMGDIESMNGGFITFRNSPWKMHLEQRSDGDGTGMQLIWRNGAADDDTDGDPEYGDHRGKFLFDGPNWAHSYDNKVWHFVVEWTRTSYKISVGENGGIPRQWFPGPGGDSGLFGGNHPYQPPSHRIELGCVPRGESMVGVIYRNFKITPQ